MTLMPPAAVCWGATAGRCPRWPGTPRTTWSQWPAQSRTARWQPAEYNNYIYNIIGKVGLWVWDRSKEPEIDRSSIVDSMNNVSSSSLSPTLLIVCLYSAHQWHRAQPQLPPGPGGPADQHQGRQGGRGHGGGDGQENTGGSTGHCGETQQCHQGCQDQEQLEAGPVVSCS